VRHGCNGAGLRPFRGHAKKDITYSEPSEVTAVEGDVQVDGPDDVDVALTPDAAEETSERLLHGAFEARGQRRLKGNPHRPAD
jgi:hypothetical protein